MAASTISFSDLFSKFDRGRVLGLNDETKILGSAVSSSFKIFGSSATVVIFSKFWLSSVLGWGIWTGFWTLLGLVILAGLL